MKYTFFKNMKVYLKYTEFLQEHHSVYVLFEYGLRPYIYLVIL